MEDVKSERVVELLKEAYFDEFESAMNYLSHAVALEGVRAERVADSLRDDVQEEVGHAEEIAERLEVLDEVPPGPVHFEDTQEELVPPERPVTDVERTIQGVISAEEDAVSHYRELAAAAEEAGDRATRHMAEEFIEDEEQHLDEFESYLEEYR